MGTSVSEESAASIFGVEWGQKVYSKQYYSTRLHGVRSLKTITVIYLGSLNFSSYVHRPYFALLIEDNYLTDLSYIKLNNTSDMYFISLCDIKDKVS
jgi:hypothetical protein